MADRLKGITFAVVDINPQTYIILQRGLFNRWKFTAYCDDPSHNQPTRIRTQDKDKTAALEMLEACARTVHPTIRN